MNMGLIIESVSANTIVSKHSITVREMFDKAVDDDGKIFMESLDAYIEQAFRTINESDESVSEKLKAKIKAVGAYIKSVFEYCMKIYQKFVSDIAIATGKYITFAQENEDKIEAGYKKLVAEDADYKSLKFSKISRDNLIKIIETKFGDIGIRLDINSATITPKEITSEQKTKLKEEIGSFADKGLKITETTKIKEVNAKDMIAIIRDALTDRVVLYNAANYMKSATGNIESVANSIATKDGANVAEIYMENIKFAAGIVSTSMGQYLHLHVKKTTTAFKFIKFCAKAGTVSTK